MDTHLISSLKVVLNGLLLGQPVLGGVVLLLGGIQALHLFLQDLVDVGYVDSLVGELGGEGGELVSSDGDLSL